MRYFIKDFIKDYEGVRGKYDVGLYIPAMLPKAISVSDPCFFAQLFIELRIFYEKDDTGSGLDMDRTKYKAAPWPDVEWNNFKAKIKEQSAFWDSKFWLIPIKRAMESLAYRQNERHLSFHLQNEYAFLGKPIPVYSRCIQCRFNLKLVDSSAEAQHSVKVGYVVPVDSTKPPISSRVSRSTAVYYHNGDVFPDASGQLTIVHEIGHSIGMPHIGVVSGHELCKVAKDNNSVPCYQGPLQNNIMGSGGEVHWLNATPWRFAFETMSGIPLVSYIVQGMPFTSEVQEVIAPFDMERWEALFGQPTDFYRHRH